MQRSALYSLVVLAAAAAVACDGRASVRRAEASTSTASAPVAEAERARQDSIVRSRPGYVIDSILPVEEEIRRFQATIAKPATRLEGGATSKSALVAAFVRALERNDTTALSHLVVDRAEFGYLVYPTSPNAAPPYRQSPQLVWLARSAATDKGLTRLFGKFGGKPLRFAGYSCADSVRHEGANTFWSSCVVNRVSAAGDTTPLRMFGSIIARAGTYKFLSLANGL